MIIIKTMNAGMCNQLFTYAYARFLVKQKQQDLVLDYSHTNSTEMIHHAMYEEALGHFALTQNRIILQKDEYDKLTKKNGKKLEQLQYLFLIRKRNRMQYLLNQERKHGDALWKRGIGLNLLAEQCPGYFEQQEAKDCILFGYWQTPKYARQIEDILQRELVEAITDNDIVKRYRDKLQEEESVCVHIRRGDYVGNAMHEVCTNAYYQAGMDYFRRTLKKPKFYLFSDDTEYVKEQYQKGNGDVYVLEEKVHDYEELIIMSGCRHFVISNSSFSWWAQFLSGSKDVIAPKRWYNDEKKVSLLYEPFWKTISENGME